MGEGRRSQVARLTRDGVLHVRRVWKCGKASGVTAQASCRESLAVTITVTDRYVHRHADGGSVSRAAIGVHVRVSDALTFDVYVPR